MIWKFLRFTACIRALIKLVQPLFLAASIKSRMSSKIKTLFGVRDKVRSILLKSVLMFAVSPEENNKSESNQKNRLLTISNGVPSLSLLACIPKQIAEQPTPPEPIIMTLLALFRINIAVSFESMQSRPTNSKFGNCAK